MSENNLGFSKYDGANSEFVGNGYRTNNKHPSFPPIMHDSRSVISSWNTETQWNNSLISQNQIHSNWKYRKYLVDNGEKIIQAQYVASCNDTGSFLDNIYKTESISNNLVNPESQTVPFFYKSFSSTDKPAGYNDSDLKQSFLEKEQLHARRITPTLSSIDAFSF
jgi:hypothetical protein